ncbi:hypothetical protein BJV82DRAFT_589031 [Fennellomyces sp. T-0311]|nr:hypothetical protein BJV82DRAFT_589031 [Fennellomyces sp. T-0311]
MREPNISYMSHSRPAVCITSGVYDRRALDCTATVPLINSLTHLAYLTSTSPRIREILVSDGGLERLVRILSTFDLPNDRRHLWKWSLAFQCVVNIGVRGTERIRTRVVEAGAVHIVTRVLENFIQAVDNAKSQNHHQNKRDPQPMTVLSPATSRGYSILNRPPPPADTIAHMLSMPPSSETPPSFVPSSSTNDNTQFRIPSTSASISYNHSNSHDTTHHHNDNNSHVHRVRVSPAAIYRRSTLPYIKIDPAQRRRNRMIRVPTSPVSVWRDPRASNIDNLFYREEDILLSLQLLAYLSKYPHIRNVFHSAYEMNVFTLVERFCHRLHASPVQYWAGVIMRNACRKDETQGGIRRCANMRCGKWEKQQREFAKCRRCRKAKYCSKACQSQAWADGHRWWCVERPENTQPSAAPTTTATAPTPATAQDTANEMEQQSPAMTNTTSGVVTEDDAVHTMVDAATRTIL